MSIFKKLPLLFLLVSFQPMLVGMVYDNRFLPLLNKPNFRTADSRLFVSAQPFCMFSSRSYGSSDEEAGLFGGIYGSYNQVAFGKALTKIGFKDPTPELKPISVKQGTVPIRNIGWLMGGHMDAAGCAFRWYYHFSPHWEIGGSALLIGARSRFEQILEDGQLDFSLLKAPNGQPLVPGDFGEKIFFAAQAQAMHEDGLKGNLWSNVGIGDLDFYLRLGMLRNYFLRFRTFDAGLKLGCYIPTAKKRDLAYPSSIPFGGDKHWGLYVDAALDTELKEDLYAGLNMRFIHRFANTQEMRFPLNHEPLNFGVLKTPLKVSPGLTFVFSPYCALNELRDGFGVFFSYTLITHGKDILSSVESSAPISAEDFDAGKQRFQNLSKWNSEYITCSLTYDFAKNKECRGATPRASLDVDVPVSILAGKQAFKTYGISLRIESDLW